MWVFFVGVMAGVTGVTTGFGLLFAWLIIRGERNERRRERENQRQLQEQRKELEMEYGQAIADLKRDMEFMKYENERELSLMHTENTELQARVSGLTEALIKMGRQIGITISAGENINVGEFVAEGKAVTTQTNIRG